MIWLIIAAWAIVAAIVCAFAFLMLVGLAFGSREKAGAKAFAHFVLGIGLRLEITNPVMLLASMWVMWTAIGAGVIGTLFALFASSY